MTKTVTLEQFLIFEPCWLDEEGGRERLERIAARKNKWTALDVLRLPDDEVSPADKLWAVLREDFIDDYTLHEFACICAERALTLADVMDERCWNAIKAKRVWLRGEISDDELYAASTAAWDAAWAAAWDAARDAARAAARAAARDAAWAAAWDAARAAAWDAAWDETWDEVWDAEQKRQCDMLIQLLESEGKEK